MKKSKRRRQVIDQLIGKVDTLISNNVGDESGSRLSSLSTAAARLRAERFDTDCTTSEKESLSFGPDSIRKGEIKTSGIKCQGSTALSAGTIQKNLPLQDLQARGHAQIYLGQVKVTVPKITSRKCQAT